MTRVVRTMVLRYAMARLQLKQQAQQRNLFFLGSDVKQEIILSIILLQTLWILLIMKLLLS
jgi:hypothetical protein